MTDSNSARALSTLRGKHLRALETIATITQDLVEAKNKSKNNVALMNETKKWAVEKKQLEADLSTLRERLQQAENSNIALIQTNTAVSSEMKQWQDQCGVLSEKIKNQKSAFVQASDEVLNLRNELSSIKGKHNLELEALATASAQDLATLGDWRRRAERLEAEHLMTSSKSQGLSGEVAKLQKEILRLKEQRKKDQAVLAEQFSKQQNVLKRQMKEMEDRVSQMKHDNDALKRENEQLKRTSNSDSNELRSAKRRIKTLEENLKEGENQHEFMNKALEQAKAEWSKLSQENAMLKQRLEQLEKIAKGGSKFAKFVAIKEENLKLSHHNARLQKAHRHLKKQHKRHGRAPGMPRRPETIT